MPAKIPNLKLLKPAQWKKILSFKYLYWLLILILLGVIIIVIRFLYTNIYQTITQSQEIVILKQQVAPDAVNLSKFNEVMEKIDKKNTATTTVTGVKDPFSFGGASDVSMPKNLVIPPGAQTD